MGERGRDGARVRVSSLLGRRYGRLPLAYGCDEANEEWVKNPTLRIQVLVLLGIGLMQAPCFLWEENRSKSLWDEEDGKEHAKAHKYHRHPENPVPTEGADCNTATNDCQRPAGLQSDSATVGGPGAEVV